LGETLGGQLKRSCQNEPGKVRINAFLELGQLRNCLVHQNFAEYAIEKSSDEICDLCRQADEFVCMVEALLQPSAAPQPESEIANE
jgi:hypothetical protein